MLITFFNNFSIRKFVVGVFYGLEELGSTESGDVKITYNSKIDNESVIHVMPWCRVPDLNKPNTMITAIPAHNFAYLRLVHEFVLPVSLHTVKYCFFCNGPILSLIHISEPTRPY